VWLWVGSGQSVLGWVGSAYCFALSTVCFALYGTLGMFGQLDKVGIKKALTT